MVTDPRGSVTYTTYDDVDHSTRTYSGWNAATGSPTGPTVVSRTDLSGTYAETLTFSAAPAVDGAGRPTGAEPITALETLTRRQFNAAGQAVAFDRYTDLAGLAHGTAATLGAEGANYLRTRYAYGKQGKVERTQTPAGTITHQVYDGLARLSSSWVGTDDTTTDGFKWTPTNGSPSSNMTRVAETEYDNGGVGNGNRTRSTRFPGAGADARITETAFDWRNRPVMVKTGAEGKPDAEDAALDRPLTYADYDNLGRQTSASVYDGDGVSAADADADGVPDRPAAWLLRQRTQFFHDTRNRVYRTEQLFVDQATGAVGPRALSTDSFYDLRGNVALEAAPGQPMKQQRHDGAGRLTTVSMLGNASLGGWAAAVSPAGSIVLEQTDFTHDAAGNTILETTRQRFHDASATATGLLGSPTAGIGARVSFAARYFDAANRLTAVVDVGTNGGGAFTRPATPPARSDTALVTSYSFDAAGRLLDTTDPRGVVNRTLSDALGRTTATIANFTGGAPGTQADVTTRFTFDSAGRLASRTAVQPAGTPSQVTGYMYGVSLATGSALVSNDELAETRYPDPVTGLASATDRDTYSVNAVRERIALTDRAGTVHSYAYDIVGRQTADTVTALGSGVDGRVRRISTTHDVLGRPVRVTSWSDPDGGAIVNQVVSVYNGFGQLTTQWQSHGEKVDPDWTPAVTMAYSEAAGGNHSRPIQVAHPDGFAVSFNYSGLDAAVSRPTSISGPRSGAEWSIGPLPADVAPSRGGTGGQRDPAPRKGIIEAFRYLGAGTVIERSRPEIRSMLTMESPTGVAGDAGDRYTGLDRFGRVVDQRWVAGQTASAPALDQTTSTYDRGGNRLTRGTPLTPALDETYTYDALGQLQSFRRGPAVAPSASQQWQFDALGNWTTLATGVDVEPRTHNAQNELTQVGSRKLSYSATGNLTADAQGRTMSFDAWNRLVSVRDASGTLLARYEYDGLNRRIVEQVATVAAASASGAPVRDLYYSSQWQVLEERIRTATGDVGKTAAARYVWSPVYIDALVMRDRDADGRSSSGTGGLEERVYAVQDANWNTTALVAASGVTGVLGGAVLGRFAYTPYGESQVLTAAGAPAAAEALAALAWQHLFQGLEFTGVTGLAHVRNRDYSPALGRFIELDPIGFKAGDNNWYRFVGNSPAQRTDPLGLCACTDPDCPPDSEDEEWYAEEVFDLWYNKRIREQFSDDDQRVMNECRLKYAACRAKAAIDKNLDRRNCDPFRKWSFWAKSICSLGVWIVVEVVGYADCMFEACSKADAAVAKCNIDLRTCLPPAVRDWGKSKPYWPFLNHVTCAKDSPSIPSQPRV
jgi:RHS repeat-associated protein